jgi:hypothetical protein
LLDFYIGQVGITPQNFWQHTWKENHLIGESYLIKQNLEWERVRYLSTMIFNVNCKKRSQMLKPEKLFSLPQDVYLEIGKAKSTPEEFEEFKKRTSNAKWKTLD